MSQPVNAVLLLRNYVPSADLSAPSAAGAPVSSLVSLDRGEVWQSPSLKVEDSTIAVRELSGQKATAVVIGLENPTDDVEVWVEHSATPISAPAGTNPPAVQVPVWPTVPLGDTGLSYREALGGARACAAYVFESSPGVPEATPMEEVRVVIWDPANPDGYVQASHLRIGPAIPLSVDDSSTYGGTANSQISKTAQGRPVYVSNPEGRVETFKGDIKGFEKANELDVLLGATRRPPVAMIPFRRNNQGVRSMPLLGYPSQATIAYREGTNYLSSFSLSVTEAL